MPFPNLNENEWRVRLHSTHSSFESQYRDILDRADWFRRICSILDEDLIEKVESWEGGTEFILDFPTPEAIDITLEAQILKDFSENAWVKSFKLIPHMKTNTQIVKFGRSEAFIRFRFWFDITN